MLFFIYEENVSLFNLEMEVDFIGDKVSIIPLLLGVLSITDLLMFLGPVVDKIDLIGPVLKYSEGLLREKGCPQTL